ncbi:hypothetical protein G5I_12220 [Acromyrmex echinatior]|uniref:DUF8207 domain-containing protein n=1 Tax=Acromyrmex echinatior TaxID=103372 RepID=F4X1Q2_ACREC|nr:hypothetical protein G5I_12220 [Acromyrmex echinatior]
MCASVKKSREIEKTSKLIRKKHRALKTDRIEEGIALDRHFKPLIEPLRLFVDNPSVCVTKRESRDENATSASKRKGKEEEEQEKEEQEGEETNETFECSTTLHKSNDRSHDRAQPITSTPRAKIDDRVERRYELGPLGQKYVEAVLRGVQDKESGIDHVYGVLHKNGLMFGNKRFDVDDTDNIIIDGVRYAGTPGLYELIFNFRRCPLHGRRYTQIQEHPIGDERAQTQVPFAGSIIEQQGIQILGV